MNQTSYQLGIQISGLAQQIQQLSTALQTQGTQLKETRDLLEAMGKAQGLEWSQDLKQWVSVAKLSALRSSPRD